MKTSKLSTSHRPHIYLAYMHRYMDGSPAPIYRAVSHNARGEGNSIYGAFKSWWYAQRRFARMQLRMSDRARLKRSVRRGPA